MWMDVSNVRPAELKRGMLERNKIRKENFPVRKHPMNLEGGDTVFDQARNEDFVVEINDPFRAEVITFIF